MESRITKIVKKEFGASVLKIKRITEGYSHYVYEIKIDKDPKEAIVRFSNNIKENANLAKEKYIIDLLLQNNIPAPKILAFHHPENKKEGYMILEKLPGTRLDSIWESLSKQEKIQVTKEMGDLLSKIHSIKFSEFGQIKEGGEIDNDKAFQFRRLGKKIPFNKYIRERLKLSFIDFARLISYKNLSSDFVSKIMKYIIDNLDDIEYSGSPVLTHGDYIPGHIFVEKNKGKYKIVGLIDFEFSESAAPEYDFIKLHRAGFFNDSELKQSLENGYGRINEKSVEIHRLLRDIGFAWVMLEAGDKELSEKTLKAIEEKIDKDLTSQT